MKSFKSGFRSSLASAVLKETTKREETILYLKGGKFPEKKWLRVGRDGES